MIERDGIMAFDVNGCTFMGFEMLQNRFAVPAWSYLIDKIKPSRIIEIGTYRGGFTACLGIIAKNAENMPSVHTFDVSNHVDEKTKRWLNVFGVDRRGDCFEKDEIAGLMRGNGVALLLCDGGDKVREFNTFAEFLKPGDIIAAHDFHDYVYWPWQEITIEQIKGTLTKYNIQPYADDILVGTGWRAFIKENA